MEIQKYDQKTQELIKRLGKNFELAKYEQVTGHKWAAIFSKLNVKTVGDVFQVETPSLASVRKYRGEDKTLELLILIIDEVLEFFSVTNKMTEAQIGMTSQLILQEYYYLTIADFRLCFNKAVLGKYGKQYNRVDGAIILEWISNYVAERKVYAQTQQTRKSHNSKKEAEFMFADLDEETQEKIKELAETIRANIGKKKPKEKKDKYQDIQEWCLDKGKNINEVFTHLQAVVYDRWEGLEFKPCEKKEQFYIWMKNGILHKLNKGFTLEMAVEKTLNGE